MYRAYISEVSFQTSIFLIDCLDLFNRRYSRRLLGPFLKSCCHLVEGVSSIAIKSQQVIITHDQDKILREIQLLRESGCGFENS